LCFVSIVEYKLLFQPLFTLPLNFLQSIKSLCLDHYLLSIYRINKVWDIKKLANSERKNILKILQLRKAISSSGLPEKFTFCTRAVLSLSPWAKNTRWPEFCTFQTWGNSELTWLMFMPSPNFFYHSTFWQRCNQYNTNFVSQGFVSTKMAKNHIYW
jgi:hypothetical protein